MVIDVHAKDVIAILVKDYCKSVDDFTWISRLRYYLREDEFYINMVNASIKYGYEYLGNSDRLVITPLTDRCY